MNIPRAYFGNIRPGICSRGASRKSLENKCTRETPGPDGVEATRQNIHSVAAESDGSYCSREAIRYIGPDRAKRIKAATVCHRE